MKNIKIRVIALVSLLFAVIVSTIVFLVDKSLTPPQDKIEELIQYADNIAYLRQGVSEKNFANIAQDVKVETILDEKSKDKSELHFIVKVQHRDFIGSVQVTYPARRDINGALMIGVPYRNTLIFVHTFPEYLLIFIGAFIGFFGLFLAIAVAILQHDIAAKKSGKGDA